MHRECRERFPLHLGLEIPTCITARAWRTCRDAYRDRLLAVSFEVCGWENVPGIPGACATCSSTYLVRGPWWSLIFRKQYVKHLHWSSLCWFTFNTLRPRQNGRRFADDTFKRIFLNENVRISIKISLKFVPKVSINNIPALVQIMAWHRLGDNALSELMMVGLLTHICVTRPQWVTDHEDS